jgi:hypothetical protein
MKPLVRTKLDLTIYPIEQIDQLDELEQEPNRFTSIDPKLKQSIGSEQTINLLPIDDFERQIILN